MSRKKLTHLYLIMVFLYSCHAYESAIAETELAFLRQGE